MTRHPILTRTKSQVDCALEYLRKGSSITPLKARHLFNTERLADVIYKIKRRGLLLEGETLVTELKYDENNKTYAEYTLLRSRARQHTKPLTQGDLFA